MCDRGHACSECHISPVWEDPRVRRVRQAIGAASVALAISPSAALAAHPGELTREVQTPSRVAAQQNAEPPLLPTPPATCGPGSRPETGIQGRVSRADHESGRDAEGFSCNTVQVSRFGRETPAGTIGGFKVERYVDADGRECAYYDTTLLYPTNLFDQEAGVNVLDMSDPADPVRTARLTTPAMLSPHESVVVSQDRGILAAVAGNAAFQVGIVDVYDISADCRHPVLKSSSPIGILGHESGLAPDGKTFYSASPGTSTIVAVDIANPSSPRVLWFGRYPSHGLSISNDGNRAYVAAIGDDSDGVDPAGQLILDVSEIQARKPDPQVTEVSRLTWESVSIPQNAIPITIDGRPYTIEIDEFGSGEQVGAGRIIDISDETKPKVLSNLRLEVHQPENFAAQADDPGHALGGLQGYAAHYCNVPQRKDPEIVACSMIASGLRVFDIRDPKRPREIAYFNAPVIPGAGEPTREPSNFAMSSPSFVPERREVWYSDANLGFYAVRLTNGVWPQGDPPKVCGGATFDIVNGARGVDEMAGIDGRRDALAGRSGDDELSGAGGADCLTGGAGNDRLSGGEGRDRIQCGLGPRDVAVADRRDRVLAGCERVIRAKA